MTLHILTGAPYPIPAGLTDALAAAGVTVVRTSDAEWLVSDMAAAQSIIGSYSGSAAELQYRQARQLAAVQAQYLQRIAAGRSYTIPGDTTTHTYQIDEIPDDAKGRQSSQQAIAAVAAMADRAIRNGVAGTPWDEGAPAFFFRDAANANVPMTAQQAYDFAANIGSYCTALKLRAISLTDQIMMATTTAAVQAIDPAAGWPSN